MNRCRIRSKRPDENATSAKWIKVVWEGASWEWHALPSALVYSLSHQFSSRLAGWTALCCYQWGLLAAGGHFTCWSKELAITIASTTLKWRERREVFSWKESCRSQFSYTCMQPVLHVPLSSPSCSLWYLMLLAYLQMSLAMSMMESAGTNRRRLFWHLLSFWGPCH